MSGPAGAAGTSDRRGEVLPIVRNDCPDSNRLEPVNPPDGGVERGQRDICAQFDRLEPGTEEYITDHGDAEAMPVVGWHRQHHRPACPAPSRKTGTKSTYQSVGDGGGEMLLPGVYLASRPALADRPQRRP